VAWPLIEERGCTLLGITISGLADGRSQQLELPLFPDVVHESGLDTALDRVRDRFGSASITRAALVGRRTGLEMPTLPDPGPLRS
jgi:DNA polymerase-4